MTSSAIWAIASPPTVADIEDGYALFEPEKLVLVYANPTFSQWFKPAALGIPVKSLLPGLNTERLVTRLAKRGYYQFSFQPAGSALQLPALLDCVFRLTPVEGADYISVHVRDLSIVKEKDAQIASHAQLIEQSNRQLARLTRRLEAENKRLGAELEVTRKMQQMLVPQQRELERIEALDIACFMEPADEVGGDYYDVLQHDGRIRIGIGDVTGHGLHSGVVMLMVQMGVRTLLASNESDPKRFLGILNHVIYDNVERMDADKSLSLSLLDYHNGRVRICGQHEEVIVVRQSGAIERLDTLDLGFPLGLDEEIGDFVAEATVDLQPGDGLVLYTDGITEAENPAGEHYQIERLCEVISRHWRGDAEAVKQAIVADLRRHIGAQEVYDDITLIVVKQR